MLALVPLSLILALTAFQQQPQRFWGGGGWRPSPEREGLPSAENGVVDRRFTFCRLLYQSIRREPMGHGWNTDYPGSDWNVLERLDVLTAARPAVWSDGLPGFAVVRASQDELFECPFLFMSDVGTVGFSNEEVARLREYLLKGGMLYVDDFWGRWAWENWSHQIGRVLPEHSIVDLDPDHTIMRTLYVVPEIPQVPSIQWWRRNGRGRYGTSEQGSDSATPHLRAIFDDDGNPLVLMTHNTDIADG